jgi:hypothetical protein
MSVGLFNYINRVIEGHVPFVDDPQRGPRRDRYMPTRLY